MEATMAYLNRPNQIHLLKQAKSEAEILAFMRKIHFDDDVLIECAITVKPTVTPKHMIPGA
jgi:hypothetical protein